MCYCWWHYCHSSLLAGLRKKIGEPRKKIRNLNGFEYRYLNGLKVPYYCRYPPLSRKVASICMAGSGGQWSGQRMMEQGRMQQPTIDGNGKAKQWLAMTRLR
jgi:hypothetical protein